MKPAIVALGLALASTAHAGTTVVVPGGVPPALAAGEHGVTSIHVFTRTGPAATARRSATATISPRTP